MENARPTMADFLQILAEEESIIDTIKAPTCLTCKSVMIEPPTGNVYCSVCRERERLSHIAQLLSE